MADVVFECRSVGLSCEWALRSDSARGVVDRFREHAKCAHSMPELSTEFVRQIESAVRPA
jgi:predicted small metal-binding protein